MKHTPHGYAITAMALVAASAAHAQGAGVQLTGQLGAGATYFNHQTGAGSLKVLNDNVLSASWLRFSGTEDLGGGFTALFRLESGVSVDTGTPTSATKFWNRQSYVGLQVAGVGLLTLGRQFHAATDRAIRTLDVYQLAPSTPHAVPLALVAVNKYAANDSRVDNAIKYRVSIPKVLDFGASVAAGEGTAGRSYSMDVAHRGDSYEVGALYLHVDAAARIATTGQLPQEKVTAFGGNVAFGPVRPYLAYFDSSLDSTVAGRLAQKNKVLDVGVNWTVTPFLTAKAAYYDDKGTNLNGIAGRNGKKSTMVVSAQYSLSKRTELYAAGFQNRFTDGYKLDPLNIAALNRDSAASSVSGLSAGMSHSF